MHINKLNNKMGRRDGREREDGQTLKKGNAKDEIQLRPGGNRKRNIHSGASSRRRATERVIRMAKQEGQRMRIQEGGAEI